MSEHTPGPWKVCQGSVFTRYYVKAVHATYVVAECGISEGKTGEANARLIAAAPDLLAALRSLFDIIGSPEIPGSPGSPMEKARAAIAKAEGR